MQDQLPPHVFLNSTSATSDEEKANLFNEYSHSVYSPDSSCNALPTITVAPNLSDTDISIHDTFTALTNLDPLKATGIDGIGPRLLKTCSTPLCTPLQHLSSMSLKNASIPSEWKIHKITPIFKSSEKPSVCNYRPISLLSSVSKVLERLIYKAIGFLYPSFSCSQFGFQEGRSTLQALLIFLSDLYNNIDNRLQTDVVYFNFRAALDTIPHNKLLCKLLFMGITGNLWLWFKSYLILRLQTVSIKNYLSQYLPVNFGVPQSSI